jgi:type IV pilus assembly protein PilQ
MRRPTPSPSALHRLALTALLTLAWTSASAQTQSESTPEAPASPIQAVQLAPLPDTEQFNSPIELRTRPAGESLDALIQILARSVGLSAITQGIPAETVVRYDLGEAKPFREVWDIVLTLNGLEYVLRDNNLVVVGPPEALAGLRPRENEAAPTVAVTYPVNSNPTQLRTLLQSQFPVGSGITVDAFEELGLLTVRATAAQHNRIREILERFDRSEVVQVRRIYPLSYARASNLAGVLLGAVFSTNTLGSSEQRTITDLCSSDAPATSTAATDTSTDTAGTTPAQEDEGAETPLSISADPRTNRLIVTAPVSVQEQIESLIATLDRPERQVNVQVRIQEVSSVATDQLGINLSAALGNFSTTLFSGDGGLNFIFDAQKAVTGLNLGAILDVFEEQGLSRRVDDSNMTVLNNGVATLQAGGTQYNYIVNSEGEVVRDAIDYGVIVGFAPQITNNNEVSLDICARVDTPSLRDEQQRIVDFTTRRTNSRITLEPGQTVVLGGLMQNQRSNTSRSVPGIGGVPVIGNLFSTDVTTESDTELLVIVTASVLE